MTAPDTGVPFEQYGGPKLLEARPEGSWYTATLPDGTPVVVLVLDPRLAAGVRFRARFFAALERASRSASPHLGVPAAWGGTSDGGLHAAFYRDLAPLEPGTRNADEVANIGAQIARALATAHAQDLVHGAITLSRISQSPDGPAHLTGIGLYDALCDGGVSARDAATGLAEIAYVSPEQQQDRLPDARSDVYALGASLYELLTGKAPYGGRTTSYVMATVLGSDSAADEAGSKGKEPVVEAIVRAIERLPDDRWPSATAFANALANALEASRPDSRNLPAEKLQRARGCLPGAAFVLAFVLVTFRVLLGG